MTPVEVEMGVAEVDKGHGSDKDNHIWVVSLAGGFKRIVTELVTVRHIVDAVLLIPGVAACVGRERVRMAVSRILQD